MGLQKFNLTCYPKLPMIWSGFPVAFWHSKGDAMLYTNLVGHLDGNSMIEMNNLAVGYFPSQTPQIGVYPAPTPAEVMGTGIVTVVEQEPVSGTNF
jgi:hypothetical protein